MLQKAFKRFCSGWANLPLQAKGLAVVSIPLAALLVATVSFNFVQQQARKADEWISHTLKVLDETQACLTLVLNAEIAAHNYALSHEREWLLLRQRAEGGLAAKLDRLDRLFRRDPIQIERLRQIKERYRRELETLAGSCAGRNPATNPSPAGDCHAMTEGLQREFREMQAEERRRLVQRRARVEVLGRRSQAAIAACAVLGLGGGFIAALLFTAGVVRRIRSLQAIAARLERRLGTLPHREGAGELSRLEAALEKAGMALRHKEQEHERFFTLSIDMLCIASLDGRFKCLNRAFTRVLGWAAEDLLAQPLLERVHPDDRVATEIQLQKLAGGAAAYFENRYRCADGSYKWLAWSSAPFPAEGLIYAVARDISYRRQSGQALRESEQRFRTIFEQSPNGIALVGLDYRLIKVNHAMCHMLGYTEEELAALTLSAILHPRDRARVLEVVRGLFALALAPYRNEERCRTKGGKTIWVTFAASVVRDSQGKPLYALALVENITERKQSEKQIVSALREKEILLREIHHRVKNNLQVVSSLLNLQARSIKDKNALEMLEVSQHRVRSMAIVHDLLHRSADLSKIDFGEYVKRLAASLFCSYGIDSAKVDLKVDVEAVRLGIDTAIPCGLIVHELVANALKHAFPEGRNGKIYIGLHESPDGRLALTVRDNGVGCVGDPASWETTSVGLRLVSLLADQIGGQVKRSICEGTQLQIFFREP